MYAEEEEEEAGRAKRTIWTLTFSLACMAAGVGASAHPSSDHKGRGAKRREISRVYRRWRLRRMVYAASGVGKKVFIQCERSQGGPKCEDEWMEEEEEKWTRKLLDQRGRPPHKSLPPFLLIVLS